MQRIALGETLPMDVIAVEPVGINRFRTTLKDDEGDVSTIYLDIELPIGRAELKIFHTGLPSPNKTTGVNPVGAGS